MSVLEFSDPAELEWTFKPLESLAALEFYELLRFRIDIFVVEQNCAYPELDAADKEDATLHVQGRLKSSGELLACARMIMANAGDAEVKTNRVVKIGRVAVAEELRGQGVARKLMLQILGYIAAEFGAPEVQLSAQTYIESFYQSLGFKTVSGEYLEDGIPHLDMELNKGVLENLLESH